MSWLRIIHQTTYRYKKAVRFGPHRLVLRPREGHDVHIEEMRVKIEPEFELATRFVTKYKNVSAQRFELEPIAYQSI
jgi:Bacterial transglutaminase-like N-terminal region